MNRREFITLLGGAAAAWPVAVRAQQPEGMRRIGVLGAGTNDADGQARVAAFRQGLRELGWHEGRNVSIDSRWGSGDSDSIRDAASELVRLKPDVLLVNGNRALSRRRAPSQSCLPGLPIQSSWASSRSWRGRAATLQASPIWSGH